MTALALGVSLIHHGNGDLRQMDFNKEQAIQQVESTTADSVEASSSYYLGEDDQLPFWFAPLPHRVIDNEYFHSNQSDFFLLVKLARYIALDQTHTVNGQKLKSGWSIPISQTTLAKRTGYSRQTINEKLLKLQLNGFIQTKDAKGRLKQYRLVDFDVGQDSVAKMQSNHTGVDSSEKASAGNQGWQSQVDAPLAGEDRAQLKIEPSRGGEGVPDRALSATGDKRLSGRADTLIDNSKKTTHPSSSNVGESRQPLSDATPPGDDSSQLSTIEPLVQSWLKNRDFRGADRVKAQTQVDQAIYAVEDVSARYGVTSGEAVSRIAGLIPEVPKRGADGDVVKCLSWLVKTSDGKDFLRARYPMMSSPADSDQQARSQARSKSKTDKDKTREMLREMRKTSVSASVPTNRRKNT